jgi:multiple sugar transport system ATP-binding protein
VEAMTMATRIAVMKLGVLQQLDTPQQLYDKPGNKFVAGFIGSPSMNFFEGKIAKSDGKIVLDADTFNVEIPKDREKVYQSYAGKPVIFGIRPEDIHNPEFTPANITPAKVSGKVEVTELMGNEIFVTLSNGEHSFVARVDPRSKYQYGDDIEVTFNMGNFHIFDKETEVAIR